MAIFTKTHKRSGVKWYYIRFTKADGRRKAERGGTTRRQAERLLAKRLGEVASGTYVDPREADKSRGPTVAEFVDRFLCDHPGKRRSDHYPDTLRYVTRYLGDRYLREINRADMDQFRIRLATTNGLKLSRPLSSTSITKVLRTAHRLFKMAVRWGELEANPAADLEKPALAKPKTRYLTREEYDRLEEGAPPWLRPILWTAVATGMRLKEVVLLRWADLDKKARVLHVADDTKTRSRQIPINGAVQEILDGQVRHLRSPYVFVDGEGDPYVSAEARNRISKATSKLAQRLEIPEATFHTLRHTAAAWMVQDGVSLYEVQRILGHSSAAMTQRYAHLRPDHLRGAMDALDAALRGSATQTATQTATQADSA